jgi:hypothetical protein
VRWIALLSSLLLATGCIAPQSQLTRLREENAQLAERIRQDRVRVANLEEQNHQLQLRISDAEKAVATLHDRAQATTLR